MVVWAKQGRTNNKGITWEEGGKGGAFSVVIQTGDKWIASWAVAAVEGMGGWVIRHNRDIKRLRQLGFIIIILSPLPGER